ncbi:AraC family transcriptional regulator [Paenibacillus selenitireducens]|uniref:AraC family transcriptional regulator n=2 Tax=Paenibacillus selenitireducens TaxID=1324314 RepID=A0A1T2XNZ2_9BACL|nr:AraC family transcriptional regulator [Paenibacillus selenitireducens]
MAVNPYPVSGELEILFSGESQTERSHRMGPTFIDYFLVHYVIAGRGTFQLRGRTYALQAGDSFFIFPKEMYQYEADEHEPWHYCWLAFQGNEAEAILHQLNISPEKPIVQAAAERRIKPLYRRLYATLHRGEPMCAMESIGYMHLLFAVYGRCNAARNPAPILDDKSDIERQVDQAIRWLTYQYAEQVSIERMSQSLGYSRIYLSKMFKQLTGISPMQYLNKIRMERAAMLMTSRLSIDQIATSVGYKDPLYFSKQYKKWSGHAPSEHRAILLGKIPKENFPPPH